MRGSRGLFSHCLSACPRRINQQRLQLLQQRCVSAPTITEDRPRSTNDDLADILDSFDSVSQQRDQESAQIASQSQPAAHGGDELSDMELLRRRDRVTKSLESFGSDIAPFYSPRKALHSPPEISSVGIAALVAAQAHMGHSTSLWNPLTQPFIYGVRDGIHLFNLDITLAHLRRAADVIKGVAQNDGNIIFVGTRPGQKRSIVEAASRAGAYHVFDRWIPGTITNGKQVVGAGRVKHLITKHKRNANPPSNPANVPNSVVPDLVVILNPLENRNLLQECAKGRVPTIGIIDSDVDPRLVTYSIPANDDSIRCTTLIAGVLSRAAQAGRSSMQMQDWEQVELP